MKSYDYGKNRQYQKWVASKPYDYFKGLTKREINILYERECLGIENFDDCENDEENKSTQKS